MRKTQWIIQKEKKKKGHDNYVHFYTDEELKKLKKYDTYEKYDHYEKNAPIVQVGGDSNKS